MSNSKQDQHFMKLAIDQAKIAEDNGDVPIGAVIVYQNQIEGRMGFSPCGNNEK